MQVQGTYGGWGSGSGSSEIVMNLCWTRAIADELLHRVCADHDPLVYRRSRRRASKADIR